MRKRAEKIVKELSEHPFPFHTEKKRADYVEGQLSLAVTAAVKEEREKRKKLEVAAEKFIEAADALKNVRRNVDKELIAALDNYYEAQGSLAALLTE